MLSNIIMQGMEKEVAYLRPIEWTELVLTGRYMVPWIKRVLDKQMSYLSIIVAHTFRVGFVIHKVHYTETLSQGRHIKKIDCLKRFRDIPTRFTLQSVIFFSWLL